MTREEAIKEIQDASDYEVRHGDIEHHYEDIMRRVEAFEKAVNALKKEPVYFPPCVDCNTKMNEIREAYDKLNSSDKKGGMTNGDMIKAVFPGCRPIEGTLLIDTDIAVFEPDWWKAPYKGTEG